MEIKASAPQSPVTTGQARSEPAQLYIGQQLTARVVAVNHELHTLTLRLAGQTVELRYDRQMPNIHSGQEIVLNVVKTHPSLSFRIAGNISEMAKALLEPVQPGPLPLTGKPSDNADVIIETLRRYLPIQDSPTVLLNALAALEKETDLPARLQELARDIVENLPQEKHLEDAGRLKHSIDNAGHLLEARLAQLGMHPGISLADDFKLKLLRLIDQLQRLKSADIAQLPEDNERMSLADILRKTQAALARIVLEQVASLPKEDGNKLVWILELPYYDGRQAQRIGLRIERDKPPAAEENSNEDWSVMLEMKPPGLGTIFCNLYSREGVLATRFWSDRQGTVDILKSHLDQLRKQLTDCGIRPGIIDVCPGEPLSTSTAQSRNVNIVYEKV